jgi:hypothetical protein
MNIAMRTWWKRVRYVLALVGLCAIATCPAAKRACIAKQRAREADELLSELGDRVADVVRATGKVPPLGAGPTPGASCCDRGGTCTSDDAMWDAPGWRALHFAIDGAFRYAYEYAPDPSGAFAVARAVGDTTCDGHVETVELRLDVHDTSVERTWRRTSAPN